MSYVFVLVYVYFREIIFAEPCFCTPYFRPKKYLTPLYLSKKNTCIYEGESNENLKSAIKI
jgi:hypothetical protein